MATKSKRTEQDEESSRGFRPYLMPGAKTYVLKVKLRGTGWSSYMSTGVKVTPHNESLGWDAACEIADYMSDLKTLAQGEPKVWELIEAIIDGKLISLKTLLAVRHAVETEATAVSKRDGRKFVAASQLEIALRIWERVSSQPIKFWIDDWAPLPPQEHRGRIAKQEQKNRYVQQLRSALPDADTLPMRWLTTANIKARLDALQATGKVVFLPGVNDEGREGVPLHSNTKDKYGDAFSLLCQYLMARGQLGTNPASALSWVPTATEKKKAKEHRGYDRDELERLLTTEPPERKRGPRWNTGGTDWVVLRAALALACSAAVEKQVLNKLQGADFALLNPKGVLDPSLLKALGITQAQVSRVLHAGGEKWETRDRLTFGYDLDLWERFVAPYVEQLALDDYFLPRASAGSRTEPKASADAQWKKLYDMLKALCEKASVTYRGFHVARHTNATQTDDDMGVVPGLTNRMANQLTGHAHDKTRQQWYVDRQNQKEFLRGYVQIDAHQRAQRPAKKAAGRGLKIAR